MEELEYSIRAAARQAGLTAHVIRAWERRYGAVEPARTASGRRVYSAAQVQRLQQLRAATEAGHSISQIAHLSDEELAAVIAAVEAAPRATAPAPADEWLKACHAAATELDANELAAVLGRGEVELGLIAFLERVVAPLLEGLGEEWSEGRTRVTHEHLTSATLRSVMGRLLLEASVAAPAPVLVAATPRGQRHELGALMGAVVAASAGWRVIYLGADLPAAEMAAAARHVEARVVLLSVVYPPDDPLLPDELRRLRRHLTPDTVMLVGGRAVVGYVEVLRGIAAREIGDMQSLRQCLEELRNA